MDSILSKISFKFIFKLISFIICLIGLLYQSSELLTQYLSGKTYASIKFGMIFNDTLPAITVCYPFFFSGSKLSGFDQELDRIHEEYMVSFKLRNEMYNHELETILGSIGHKIEQFYIKISMKKSLSINEIFNYTQPFKFDGHNMITVKLVGNVDSIIEKDIKLIKMSSKANHFEYTGSPIESIHYYPFTTENQGNVHYHSDNRKLFTFFSWLDEKWRHFHIDLDQIIMEFEQIKSYPPIHNNYDTYLLAIHSPHSLPELNSYPEYITIHRYSSDVFKFYQVYIDLLNPKYDTNCIEYDFDYKFANNNMRSDCISHCYLDKKRQKCNTNGIILSNYLLRKELFMHDKTYFEELILSKTNWKL